jgi:hypothetical protein
MAYVESQHYFTESSLQEANLQETTEKADIVWPFVGAFEGSQGAFDACSIAAV